MSKHKTWALGQQRRTEYKRRQWILVASWIPLLGALAVLMIDTEKETSVLQVLTLGRALSEIGWLGLWAAILAACALFHVVVARIFWRCPACEGFLGGKVIDKYCPYCAAKLTDTGVPDNP